EAPDPHEPVGLVQIAELPYDRHPLGLLALDEFPVEQADQDISLTRPQRVLPQFDDRVAVTVHQFVSFDVTIAVTAMAARRPRCGVTSAPATSCAARRRPRRVPV